MEFNEFAQLVHDRVHQMLSKGEAYVVDASKDDMWETYLAAFPPGTNPMFRQRTEHDCSCCKSFIRGVGNLVTLSSDGEVQTIWDVQIEDGPYKVVAAALAEFVRCGSVNRVFRSREHRYGTKSNIEKLETGGEICWNHFWCEVPTKFVAESVGDAQADSLAAQEVLSRGLAKLGLEHVDTVLDLITSNALYRGEEHANLVKGFRALKQTYDALPAHKRENFAWLHAASPAARFRNTVIGTLVVDLAEGVPLERAVAAFEKKVAPENYKRTSAVITPSMVENALATLRSLNLEGALHRRSARLSDISPADVLFVDRGVSLLMKDPLRDLLMSATAAPGKANNKNSIDIKAEDFFRDVLPGAESIELYFESRHLNNLVTLTAPQEPGEGRLFSWHNDFAWCYHGNLADSSMREAVVARGGRVDGVFRFTHSWNHPGRRNASLMDLHVFLPGWNGSVQSQDAEFYGNGHRVGWNHRRHVDSGGNQDVDYTNPAPTGYVPVENITFPTLKRMPEGKYICKIHNWQHRNPTEAGFRAEIEVAGNLYQYDYPKLLNHKEWVTVAEVQLKAGQFTVTHHLKPTNFVDTVWGIQTSKPVPVDTVMLSPNFWGGREIGNKHYLFMLRNCKNPDPIRGFFNEQLRSDLTPHRKTFEVLASKMMVVPADDQLSGVGFSSTQRNSVTLSVRKGGARRTYTVQF